MQALLRVLGKPVKEDGLGKHQSHCPTQSLTSISRFLETLMTFACVQLPGLSSTAGLPLRPSAAGTEWGQHPIRRVLLDQVAAKAMPSSGLERSLGFDHLQVAGPGDHFTDPVQNRRVGAERAGDPRRGSLMVVAVLLCLHT